MDMTCERREVTDRNNIVARYHYLCSRGAYKFARRREDRADLEQVAALGLIKAAERYRPTLGTPFEAYAWIMIQGELLHYVRDHERIVRAPRRLRELDHRWKEAQTVLTGALQRDPEDAEIAEHLRLHPTAAAELHEYRERGRIASLDALHPRHASYTIEDHDDRIVLEWALSRLSELERAILQATFEDDVSVNDVATRLGYSSRHVSRIRRAALQKIVPLCVQS